MATSNHYKRIQDDTLRELLDVVPAVSLVGPRGVGKTTTAEQIANTSINLDIPATRSVVEADVDRFVDSPEPILVDEWQRLPQVWDIVRRAVDADDRPGRFILTGSAKPTNPPTHTGAGRIVMMRMRPMSLHERWASTREPTVSLAKLLGGGSQGSQAGLVKIVGETDVTLQDYMDEIVAGGFPGMRSRNGGKPPGQRKPTSRRWPANLRLAAYCENIVDTEFGLEGVVVRNPAALHSLLVAYAAATSTTASLNTISEATSSISDSKPAKKTVLNYIDKLKQMWLVDPIDGWVPTRNTIKRLTQAPKHHLTDPALAAALLGADAELLSLGRAAGSSGLIDSKLPSQLFESLIALNLRVYAQASGAKVFHCRTRAGEHEVDFIIERADRRVMAVEVKFKEVADEKDYRHLRWLKRELGDDLLDAVMVTTGSYAYRRPEDGIAVVPAALLGL